MFNSKREEIHLLEENFKAKIEFSFDENFSLHEPLIEIFENKSDSKIINKKNKDVKIAIKKDQHKTTNKKKAKKNQKNKTKIPKKLNTTKPKTEKNDKKILKKENNEKISEKYGWWSN